MVLYLGTAFAAGVVSFISPCVLPIIPGFLAYLAGGAAAHPRRGAIFLQSVYFVLGFSVVFAVLGVLINGLLAHSGALLQAWLARAGGVIIIAFGLYLTGLLPLPFLERDHKFAVGRFSSRSLTSFLFGAAFAAGWTPCVGAVLGSIIALAATQPGSSLFLFFAYAVGLGIPFLLVGLFTAQAQRLALRWASTAHVVNIIFGIFLIVLGVLAFTQELPLLFGAPFINSTLLFLHI